MPAANHHRKWKIPEDDGLFPVNMTQELKNAVKEELTHGLPFLFGEETGEPLPYLVEPIPLANQVNTVLLFSRFSELHDLIDNYLPGLVSRICAEDCPEHHEMLEALSGTAGAIKDIHPSWINIIEHAVSYSVRQPQAFPA
ncbi:MAG: hypothetical protein M3O22_05920 [Pseudomonadota bacterium]|nr:hypothetical protein [Pseudomonadota bacterium]